jgi:hypothetical protein
MKVLNTGNKQHELLQFADKAIGLHECPLMRLHFMKPYAP